MAAAAHAFHLVHLLLGLVVLACCQDVQNPQQRSRYANPYNSGGYNVPPPPPDAPGSKTYFYKDRRYGYQPSYLDPYYNRGPTRPPEDRYNHEVSAAGLFLASLRCDARVCDGCGRGMCIRYAYDDVGYNLFTGTTASVSQ